jgi:hypothetical protein
LAREADPETKINILKILVKKEKILQQREIKHHKKIESHKKSMKFKNNQK